MEQGQTPPPPDERRPWYYRNWFLFPTFLLGWPIPDIPMLWPVWAVLILRSPWHRGFITGTLAWAMLISGAWMVSLRILDTTTSVVFTVVTLAPGVVLTATTQTLWARHRKELLGGESGPRPAPMAVKGPLRSRQERQRRRVRRRGSRPGRSSRHPF